MGELATGSEARYPSEGVRRGAGVGTKFRVTYPGRPPGLQGGEALVVIEDERTR